MTPKIESNFEKSILLTPGAVNVLQVSPGKTRLRDHLVLSGVTLAEITQIELVLNGEVVRNLGSAVEADVIQQYNGLPAYSTNSVLTISHVREGLRRFAESMMTGIGMATKTTNGQRPITSMEYRFTVAGTASATDSIALYSQSTAPTNPGVLLYENVETHLLTTNGEQQIRDLVKGPEEIDSIFLYENTLSVDSMIVQVANREIFNRTEGVNKQVVDCSGFKTYQTEFFPFDKSENGWGKEPLIVTPQDELVLKPTVSSTSGSTSVKVFKRHLKAW